MKKSMITFLKINSALPILYAILLLPSSTFAADRELCPKEIYTLQSILKPIDGFDAVIDKKIHSLNEVIFFIGHPSNKNAPLPDEETELKKRKYKFTWTVDNSYWISCGYFGTAVALIKELPRGLNKCSVVKDYREVDSVTCD